MTATRRLELLRQINGRADDEALLFLIGWSAPELTCGELRALLDNTFTCAARAAATDPPQDCDWPFCGCDPYASKVIDTLDECGKLTLKPVLTTSHPMPLIGESMGLSENLIVVPRKS